MRSTLRSLSLLAALALLAPAACKPKPEPPASPPHESPAIAPMLPAYYDSIEPVPVLIASDTLPGAGQPMRLRASSGGMPFGLSTFLPTSLWGGSTMFNATIVSGAPELMQGILRLAARTGMRLAFTIRRSDMTCNGQQIGLFCPDRGRQAVDRIAAALPKDTVAKYRRNLLYVSALDDMGCAECWGGRAITGAETAAHTKYAHAKLSPLGIPIGLRVGTDWMSRQGVDWQQSVDVANAQYTTMKGSQTDYYATQARLASSVGVEKLAYSVNVHYCGGNKDPHPCPADQLTRSLKIALTYDPARNCAFMGWRYDKYEVQARAPAYTDAAAIARNRPNVPDCGR